MQEIKNVNRGAAVSGMDMRYGAPRQPQYAPRVQPNIQNQPASLNTQETNNSPFRGNSFTTNSAPAEPSFRATQEITEVSIGDFGKSPAEDNKDSMWDLPPILRSKSE